MSRPKAEFDSCDMLLCPKCGANNMHITRHDTGRTPDRYGDSTVELQMYGECGHGATLILYTHKGSTYADWTNIHDLPIDDPDPPYMEEPPDPGPNPRFI